MTGRRLIRASRLCAIGAAVAVFAIGGVADAAGIALSGMAGVLLAQAPPPPPPPPPTPPAPKPPPTPVKPKKKKKKVPPAPAPATPLPKPKPPVQEVKPLAPVPIQPGTPLTPAGDPGKKIIIIKKLDEPQPPATIIIETTPSATDNAPIIIKTAPDSNAAAAPPVSEPTAPGRARKRYSQYDHICVTYDRFTITDTLNDAGDKGWELVNIGGMGDSGQLLCFRRPRGSSL